MFCFATAAQKLSIFELSGTFKSHISSLLHDCEDRTPHSEPIPCTIPLLHRPKSLVSPYMLLGSFLRLRQLEIELQIRLQLKFGSTLDV